MRSVHIYLFIAFLHFYFVHRIGIRNKRQLLQLLGRVGHGVLLSDIESCYIGLSKIFLDCSKVPFIS